MAGYCTTTNGHGSVSMDMLIGSLPAALEANVAFRVVAGIRTGPTGPWWLGVTHDPGWAYSNEPFVAHLEAINLATSVALASESFVIDGGPQAGEFGKFVRDIDADLEANCSSPAYVCETVPDVLGEGWDQDQCEAWAVEDSEDDDGGGDVAPSDDDGDDDGDGEESDATDRDPSGGCRAAGTPPSWFVLFGLVWVRRRRVDAV